MTLEQLWTVAQRWYAGRFDPEWQPRAVEESQAILTEAGLTGEFWQLQP
jgi:hypothetical protein